MDYGLSTHLFVGQRLNPAVLHLIAAEGFHTVEIFAQRQHFDFRDPGQVSEISGWLRDHPLRIRSLHAPLYQGFHWGGDGSPAISLADLEKRRRIESMDEVRRAVEVAETIPFEYLVVHLGLSGETYSLEKFDAAFSSLEHLLIFAKQRGVKILLENIPNELSLPCRLVEFVQYTKMDELEFCLDIGHAHLTTGVLDAFKHLKGRIASTHVHDNRGGNDEHLFPFEGEVDWNPVVKEFRAGEKRFPVVFELRDYGGPNNLMKLRGVMDRFDKHP